PHASLGYSPIAARLMVSTISRSFITSGSWEATKGENRVLALSLLARAQALTAHVLCAIPYGVVIAVEIRGACVAALRAAILPAAGVLDHLPERQTHALKVEGA